MNKNIFLILVLLPIILFADYHDSNVSLEWFGHSNSYLGTFVKQNSLKGGKTYSIGIAQSMYQSLDFLSVDSINFNLIEIVNDLNTFIESLDNEIIPRFSIDTSQPNTNADIVIHYRDHYYDSAGENIFEDNVPGVVATTAWQAFEKADIYINENKHYHWHKDGGLNKSEAELFFDINTVIRHELCHLLGVSHEHVLIDELTLMSDGSIHGNHKNPPMDYGLDESILIRKNYSSPLIAIYDDEDNIINNNIVYVGQNVKFKLTLTEFEVPSNDYYDYYYFDHGIVCGFLKEYSSNTYWQTPYNFSIYNEETRKGLSIERFTMPEFQGPGQYQYVTNYEQDWIPQEQHKGNLKFYLFNRRFREPDNIVDKNFIYEND